MELSTEKKKWDELKIRLKNIYPQLTEADLDDNEDKKENTLRMIEYKLSKTKEEMQEIISDIIMY
ncbi:MAG: hypothetical protein NTZ33_06890 [Bacteroidetes bacterium]|nr:hypothetical protein [Bacteroidota bacterium]